MKKAFLTIALLLAVASIGHAQKIAVRTNGVGWISALTMNVGAEVALWPKLTLSADAYYNPFADWGNNRSTRLWGVQPELKYWFCRKFYSHYIGLHGQYSQFDAGLFKHIYEGSYYGVGLSYGYSLPIAYRWRLDFSLGLGWKHWDREVYNRIGDTALPDPGHDGGNKEFVKDPWPRDGFGVTKVGVSVVFIIR